MTAATITRTQPAAGLAELLELWADGACPPDFCAACVRVIEDRCDDCARREYISAILNAAIGKVRQAPDDVAALAVYMKTVMQLTGVYPGTAAVLSGAEARS